MVTATIAHIKTGFAITFTTSNYSSSTSAPKVIERIPRVARQDINRLRVSGSGPHRLDCSLLHRDGPTRRRDGPIESALGPGNMRNLAFELHGDNRWTATISATFHILGF